MSILKLFASAGIVILMLGEGKFQHLDNGSLSHILNYFKIKCSPHLFFISNSIKNVLQIIIFLLAKQAYPLLKLSGNFPLDV